MKDDSKILVVDDDEGVLTAARLLLKSNGYQVLTEKRPDQVPAILETEHIGVVLLDMNFRSQLNTGNEGLYWLRQIKAKRPEIVCIMITAYGDVELAVQCLKEGASDFVLKPWHNEKLLATVHAARQLYVAHRKADKLHYEKDMLKADLNRGYGTFIGESPAIQRVFKTIEKVASTDVNVLILGENGTGKDLVARAICRESPRKDKPFVAVDMGSVSESLFESELFGHVKGAFTDAREDRPGRFEVANGGTIFLDEIGNLSLAMQSKLLQVLQNREVIRVGAHRPVALDVRLICATNQPLHQMVQERRFRQDLLYRINTVEIQLPPLRERKGDIPLLTDYFLKMYGKKYQKEAKKITPGCAAILEKYPWYGNVRELQHALERAVIMSDSDILLPEDILPANPPATVSDKEENVNLEESERRLIEKALKKYAGNISYAARELGLSRAALYRRMEKFGL